MSKTIRYIIVDDELIAREVLETHLIKISNFTQVASCKNALEAFQVLNSEEVDLIFLDINMPEISGLSFAKAISKSTKIIFTTAYREYAVDGFDLQAVDYLLKPISFERLLQSVNKYLGENFKDSGLTEETNGEYSDSIFVRADRKMVKVVFSEINYIESLSDYVKIYVSGSPIITRETISNIEAKLPKDDFIRVHRSFIVSLDKIKSFTNETIDLEGKEVPISRSYRNAVLARLGR